MNLRFRDHSPLGLLCSNTLPEGRLQKMGLKIDHSQATCDFGEVGFRYRTPFIGGRLFIVS